MYKVLFCYVFMLKRHQKDGVVYNTLANSIDLFTTDQNTQCMHTHMHTYTHTQKPIHNTNINWLNRNLMFI